MQDFITRHTSSKELKTIAGNVFSGQRISCEEGILLFEKADIGFLGCLADYICEKQNGKQVFFNKNIHIEPTNICINKCRFCSYSREKGQNGGWEMSEKEMLEKVKTLPGDITEIHIVGGIHPDRKMDFYTSLLSKVKALKPHACIKAFTAPEIDYMIVHSNMSLQEGIAELKKSGLEMVPGGGAEIFDESLRAEICPEKINAQRWLEIHEMLHKNGIQTNATILYGHKETYAQRIDHLNRLRLLQDKTSGFNAFIPLKFKNQNNPMQHIKEVSIIEDIKMYAVARIFLDNVPHIKAYWPAVGKEFAQLSLSFGVDDLDGTINNSTKIYSMAGAKDTDPSMTEEEMRELIIQAGKEPVQRDSYYKIIKRY